MRLMNPQPERHAPIFRDPTIEVFILREIFIGGIAREIGSKALVSQSDAHALSQTVPPTVEFLK
jgi:hypothetical protein